MVMTVERSHLVTPMRWGDLASGADASAPGQAGARNEPTDNLTLVLPGAPESCEGYLLSAAGAKQISTRRVAGGLSVSVEALPEDAVLLLTEDGQAFSRVEQYLRRYAPRAARVRVELAALRRQEAAAAAARLSSELIDSVEAEPDLASVDAAMTAIHRTLASSDYAAAFARAASVERLLEQLQRRIYRRLWPDDSPGASPMRGQWSTLPELEQAAIALARSGESLQPLAGGEFESLEELLTMGWKRSDQSPAGIETKVRLSPSGPHAGRFCLELDARGTHPGPLPPTLAGAPVWITSPPIAVQKGGLIEVVGWVRVDEPPMGSAEPVVIFDSLGGEESGVRIASAPLWTRFRLVRAAPPGGECRVTIALGGVGRVAVDSLGYRVLPLPRSGAPAASGGAQ
jgi:hypothetical protein